MVEKKVVGADVEGDQVVALRLQHDEVVKADVVVLAMGPWTGQGRVATPKYIYERYRNPYSGISADQQATAPVVDDQLTFSCSTCVLLFIP